jgi:pilus assembly protein Flp/PilA
MAKSAAQLHRRIVPGVRLGRSSDGETTMNTLLLKLYLKSQDLKNYEEGQDMVEYALVVALLSLAAISAMQGVGAAIVGQYNNISTGIG